MVTLFYGEGLPLSATQISPNIFISCNHGLSTAYTADFDPKMTWSEIPLDKTKNYFVLKAADGSINPDYAEVEAIYECKGLDITIIKTLTKIQYQRNDVFNITKFTGTEKITTIEACGFGANQIKSYQTNKSKKLEESIYSYNPSNTLDLYRIFYDSKRVLFNITSKYKLLVGIMSRNKPMNISVGPGDSGGPLLINGKFCGVISGGLMIDKQLPIIGSHTDIINNLFTPFTPNIFRGIRTKITEILDHG